MLSLYYLYFHHVTRCVRHINVATVVRWLTNSIRLNSPFGDMQFLEAQKVDPESFCDRLPSSKANVNGKDGYQQPQPRPRLPRGGTEGERQ